MELVHRGGVSKEMAMADYLSRVSIQGNIKGAKTAVVKVSEEGDIPIKGFLSMEKIKKVQDGDAEIRAWKKAITAPSGEDVSAERGGKFLSNLVQNGNGALWILYN